MASSNRTKPVALQVNNSGAWKTVAKLDGAEDATCAGALDAANTLGNCDQSGRTTWRVISEDGLDRVLMRWDTVRGWHEVKQC